MSEATGNLGRWLGNIREDRPSSDVAHLPHKKLMVRRRTLCARLQFTGHFMVDLSFSD